MGLDHGFCFLNVDNVCNDQHDIKSMYSCHRQDHVMDRIVKESYYNRDDTKYLPDYINVDLDLCRRILLVCNELFTMHVKNDISGILKSPYWISEKTIEFDMIEVSNLLYEVVDLMTKYNKEFLRGNIVYFYTNE